MPGLRRLRGVEGDGKLDGEETDQEAHKEKEAPEEGRARIRKDVCVRRMWSGYCDGIRMPGL